MPFTWDGQFVLRRLNEEDPEQHRIYKFSRDASDITDADNTFDIAPYLAARARYDAVPVMPQRSWLVTLKGQGPSVEMGVYQLRKIQ
jgi:hypothetical protein